MRSLWGILVATVLLVACDDGGTPAGRSPEALAAWTDGREFDLSIRLVNGQGVPVEQTVVVGDTNSQRLAGFVDERCAGEVGSRFTKNQTQPPQTGMSATCGRRGALAQQLALCRAYQYLQFADAVTSTEIFHVSGNVTIRPRPAEPLANDPFATRTPEAVLPVPGASSAASFALVAASHFQSAGFAGAAAFGINCAEDTLLATVPAGRLPTGEWSTDRVPLAFVVSSGTAEATRMIGEAAQVARNRLEAAAQQRLSRDRDAPRATRGHWRGRHDSRLEIANLLAGVPAGLFETDDGTAGPESLTVADLAPESDVDRRAEELVRSLRVDPRLPDSDLYDAVRDALAEDLPQAFGAGAMASDPVDYLRGVGVDSRDLRQAARRVVQESESTGRPILVLPLSSLGARPRVAGTAPTTTPADPAFLFARTAGAGRFEDMAVTSADEHAPSPDYAKRGVLNTQDYLAQAMERALQRDDVRQVPSAATLLDQGRLMAREIVGMRVQVAVGETTFTCPPFPFPCERPPFGGDDLSAVRIRLYGARGDASQYQIWRGEEGLQCAQTGRIEGQPCDPTAYHVPVPAAVRTDGALSGLGGRYLEWSIVPPAPDVPGATLRDGDRLYIVAAPGTTGTEAGSATGSPTLPSAPLVGFEVSAGTASSPSSPWTRVSQLVAGTDVTATFAGVLTPDPVQLPRALFGCAGVPNDVRIPLEDELTEATDGRDDIESSWAHYLRLAHQAADEADALGEELIRQGVEMDLRAEHARDELESLCGGVVNVGSLDAPPPSACTCPGGESECVCPDADLDGQPDPGCTFAAGVESCTRCVGGLCLASGITGLLSDSPDLDSVRRCLGEDGGLVNAALGNTPLCMWRYTGGDGVTLPPCVCPEGRSDCPTLTGAAACPAPIGASNCTDIYSLEPPYEVLPPSEVMGLAPSAQRAAAPANCADLARVRNRVLSDPRLLDRVLHTELLELTTIRAVAASIGYREDHLRFSTVTRAGRDWLSTGDVFGGPRTTDERPTCGPVAVAATPLWMELGCDPMLDPPPDGKSILCGIGRCDTFASRDETSDRIRRAIGALARISGTIGPTMGGGEFPIYPSPEFVGDDEDLSPPRSFPAWLRSLPEICVSEDDCLDGSIRHPDNGCPGPHHAAGVPVRKQDRMDRDPSGLT